MKKNTRQTHRRSAYVMLADIRGNHEQSRRCAVEPRHRGREAAHLGAQIAGALPHRLAVWLAPMLALALATPTGCATGRFRYDELDEKQDNVEMRELDDLVRDSGQSSAPDPDVVVERVDYDFAHERDEYRIGSNDVLNVFVMDHPEMSSQRINLGEISGSTVRKDGSVHLPVIGQIPAAGLTVTEFEAELAKRAAQYVIAPQVSTEVLEYGSQKFFVLGKVRMPGTFPVDGDTTLLEALSLAGGVDPQGNLESATVVRGGKLMPINLADLVKRGDVSRNVFMRAGDLVYVPDASHLKIYVLGEVLAPTVVPIADGRVTLAEALAAAGGPTPARARREIAVIRGGFSKPIIYRIDLERALLLDDKILLKAGDRVVIAPTGLSNASRYMQQFLPFLMGAQAAGLAAQGATTVASKAAAATAAAN